MEGRKEGRKDTIKFRSHKSGDKRARSFFEYNYNNIVSMMSLPFLHRQQEPEKISTWRINIRREKEKSGYCCYLLVVACRWVNKVTLEQHET